MLLYLMRCRLGSPSSLASVSSMMMSSVLLKVDRASLEGRPHDHCMTSCRLLASVKGPRTYGSQAGLADKALRMSALRLDASNRLQQRHGHVASIHCLASEASKRMLTAADAQCVHTCQLSQLVCICTDTDLTRIWQYNVADSVTDVGGP